MLNNTMITRRVDDLGRVVIPREIRRNMRIKEGDKFELWVDEHGVYFKHLNDYFKHLNDIASLAGRLRVMIECDLDEVFCSLNPGKREEVAQLLRQAERILKEEDR